MHRKYQGFCSNIIVYEKGKKNMAKYIPPSLLD